MTPGDAESTEAAEQQQSSVIEAAAQVAAATDATASTSAAAAAAAAVVAAATVAMDPTPVLPPVVATTTPTATATPLAPTPLVAPTTTATTTTAGISTTPTTSSADPIYEVIIVGGGLAGCCVARRLFDEGISFLLLEATDRLGGRIRVVADHVDVGAAWMWPEFQPQMKQTIEATNVDTFTQPDDACSTRVCGGMIQLIHQLVQPIPALKIRLQSPVVKVLVPQTQDPAATTPPTEEMIQVQVQPSSSTTTTTTSTPLLYQCRRIVLAAPPRVLHNKIHFTPALTAAKQAAMVSSHTWMAGCAKVVLMYPTPKFWNHEHSSILLSQDGPAFQVYDGTDRDGKTAVLTFCCTLQEHANQTDEEIAKKVALQLESTWNAYGWKDYAGMAQTYTSCHVHNWTTCDYVSEAPKCFHSHPTVVPALSTTEWDGRLYLAGSEADNKHPGLMEGAIGAANRVAAAIVEQARP